MKKIADFFTSHFWAIYFVGFLIVLFLAIFSFAKKRSNIEITVVSEKDIHSDQLLSDSETKPVSSDYDYSFEDFKTDFMNDIDVSEVNLPIFAREVEMTFYTPTGSACKNGSYPTENHTVAFASEYIGCECDIYSLDGELIGHYYIEDTGKGRLMENGELTIPSGNCVDVFFENESDGWAFIDEWKNDDMSSRVYIEIYEQ